VGAALAEQLIQRGASLLLNERIVD